MGGCTNSRILIASTPSHLYSENGQQTFVVTTRHPTATLARLFQPFYGPGCRAIGSGIIQEARTASGEASSRFLHVYPVLLAYPSDLVACLCQL
jgi:hypothetical protein